MARADRSARKRNERKQKQESQPASTDHHVFSEAFTLLLCPQQQHYSTIYITYTEHWAEISIVRRMVWFMMVSVCRLWAARQLITMSMFDIYIIIIIYRCEGKKIVVMKQYHTVNMGQRWRHPCNRMYLHTALQTAAVNPEVPRTILLLTLLPQRLCCVCGSYFFCCCCLSVLWTALTRAHATASCACNDACQGIAFFVLRYPLRLFCDLCTMYANNKRSSKGIQYKEHKPQEAHSSVPCKSLKCGNAICMRVYVSSDSIACSMFVALLWIFDMQRDHFYSILYTSTY